MVHINRLIKHIPMIFTRLPLDPCFASIMSPNDLLQMINPRLVWFLGVNRTVLVLDH